MIAEIERAHEIVAGSNRVVVLTGAGISTASGIPDFRGPEGLWTKDPHAEMLSTYEVWLTRTDVRERAWQSRLDRRGIEVEPNAGHLAVNVLDQRGTLSLLVTQNIDGLHHRAGTTPSRIVEIHGSSRDVVCLTCNDRWPMEMIYPRLERGDLDPHCENLVGNSACGGLLKSAVISFGQSLVAADLERAQLAASRCEVLLCVGSTLAVFPAAGIVPIAARGGAAIVIVNHQPTDMDALAKVVVNEDISDVLPEITRA
jgi:NAD-dependent deacetylase